MSTINYIKPTKQAIFDACDGQVSKTCIVRRDGEWVVKGKFCILAPLDDGTWDLWICNPGDLRIGLHQRRVNDRVRKLKIIPQNRPFTILKGEAHATLPGLDDLVSNPDLLRLLGIRRRKRLTEAQKNALVERLAGRRKVKAA